jgi:hypothetical protein
VLVLRMSSIGRPLKGLALSLSLCLLVICLGACTPRATRLPPATPAALPPDALESDGTMSWWACRFKMSWPANAGVDWQADLMLAHAVVGPVLTEHGRKLSLWRFHRRALRDKSGHRFSFLFYSDSALAAEVMQDLRTSQVLQQALEDGIVEQVYFDDPDSPGHPEIEAMSDPHWSPSLQRNWPSYIMGVSALWLGLIDDRMADAPAYDGDVSGLLEQYRQADKDINALWYREGEHAFIHHLSAMFGYEPLLVTKEIRF